MIKVLITTTYIRNPGVGVHTLVVEFGSIPEADEAIARINGQRAERESSYDQTAIRLN